MNKVPPLVAVAPRGSYLNVGFTPISDFLYLLVTYLYLLPIKYIISIAYKNYIYKF